MCMHRASGSSLGMRIVANRCSLLGFPALTVSPVADEVALEQISHPRSYSKGAHAFALKTWGQNTEVWKLRGPRGPLLGATAHVVHKDPSFLISSLEGFWRRRRLRLRGLGFCGL